MLFGPIFEYFDPIGGEIPPHLSGEFSFIAGTARRLLEGLPRYEVVQRAELIDAILAETWTDRASEQLEALAEAAERGEPAERFDSSLGKSTHDLEWCMGRVELPTTPTGERLRWSELFAVLALGLIAHAWEELDDLRRRQITAESDEAAVLDYMALYAVEAMEAISKAQLLVRIEDVEENFQQKLATAAESTIRSRSTAAAQKRHAPINRIKHRFIRWYLQNQDSGLFHSRAQAAERFYRDLPSEEQKLLSRRNAPRTLLDALRVHLRQSDEDAP